MFHSKDSGFVFIVSLILLFATTLLVINSMRSTTLNERIPGSYKDRNLAFQSAEKALREAESSLVNSTNADNCLIGCTTGVGIGSQLNTIPTTWVDTGSFTTANGGKYLINLLNDVFLPSTKPATLCKAYSIRALGNGLNSNTSVVLQSTAFVCDSSIT